MLIGSLQQIRFASLNQAIPRGFPGLPPGTSPAPRVVPRPIPEKAGRVYKRGMTLTDIPVFRKHVYFYALLVLSTLFLASLKPVHVKAASQNVVAVEEVAKYLLVE